MVCCEASFGCSLFELGRMIYTGCFVYFAMCIVPPLLHLALLVSSSVCGSVFIESVCYVTKKSASQILFSREVFCIPPVE